LIRDITVIGAGPVGLSSAFWAGMRSASCQIVESLPELGGQCASLYPEKWIYDVPGAPRVLARELIERLSEQAFQFDTPVHLSTTVQSVTQDDVLTLHTDRGDLQTRTLIVAGGHGAVEPRRLPELDVSPWEGDGVSYLVRSPAELAGRRVLVVGGGDSAVDWALNLREVAAAVTLVHRRERFRAHPATLGEALADPRIEVRTPYTLHELHGHPLRAATLAHREDGSLERLDCDAVLLQLGFLSKLGPLESWGFALDAGSLVVDGLMRTSLDRVWACGDITSYPGKLKLIATGFAEAATAVAQAVLAIRPDEQLQPGYSTNTGVPGVVAGQP
jgi:thioredoxin reductase (NADPH)